jgi:Protein of unknown function (DUF2815)
MRNGVNGMPHRGIFTASPVGLRTAVTTATIRRRLKAHSTISNHEDDMKILLRDVRLAFPNLWKATAPKGGGEVAFSASFLLLPNHKQIPEIKKAMLSLATEKWGAKGAATYKALESSDKLALHNGDSKSEYEGFEGNLYVSTRSRVRPSVFDGQRQELTEADGKPYSGCYVNASIELWAQDNSYGKRINAQLRGVQFLRDGDAFAGGGKAADAEEFDDLGVPDDTSGNDDLAA